MTNLTFTRHDWKTATMPLLTLALWTTALLLNLVILTGRNYLDSMMCLPSLVISILVMLCAVYDVHKASIKHHAFHAFGAPFIAIVLQSFWMASANRVECSLSKLETAGTPLRNYDFRCNLFYAGTAAICAAYAAGISLIIARVVQVLDDARTRRRQRSAQEAREADIEMTERPLMPSLRFT